MLEKQELRSRIEALEKIEFYISICSRKGGVDFVVSALSNAMIAGGTIFLGFGMARDHFENLHAINQNWIFVLSAAFAIFVYYISIHYPVLTASHSDRLNALLASYSPVSSAEAYKDLQSKLKRPQKVAMGEELKYFRKWLAEEWCAIEKVRGDHLNISTDLKSRVLDHAGVRSQVSSAMINHSWVAHAYPLQQLTIRLQGTRHSEKAAIVCQLETVLSRLRAGELCGHDHDDDFGYAFEYVEATNGPSFFDEPAGVI